MADTEIVTYDDRGTGQPVMTIEQAKARREEMARFTTSILQKDIDFGAIPGTGTKPTLLKPGAEKLCSFFGLQVDLRVADRLEDWDRGLFFYRYSCTILREGVPIAVAEGSCNSREKKYRWRKGERLCPKCKAPAINKSKRESEGYYCWTKKGGCGATFKLGDPAIEGQSLADIENTEPFDLVNTIQKMAQKRAHVAATLIATGASEFFTQDMDDFIQHVEPQPAQQQQSQDYDIPMELVKEIGSLGIEVYGDDWHKGKEAESVQYVSNSQIRNVSELTLREGERLRSLLQKKFDKEREAQATGKAA